MLIKGKERSKRQNCGNIKQTFTLLNKSSKVQNDNGGFRKGFNVEKKCHRKYWSHIQIGRVTEKNNILRHHILI